MEEPSIESSLPGRNEGLELELELDWNCIAKLITLLLIRIALHNWLDYLIITALQNRTTNCKQKNSSAPLQNVDVEQEDDDRNEFLKLLELKKEKKEHGKESWGIGRT